MARKQALIDLRDKVKAGEWDCLSESYPLPSDTYSNFGRACEDGSLDAAKALHEAVLPGGAKWSYYSDDGHCIVSYGGGIHDYAEAHDPDNPARAWLVAIISALIEMESD